MTNPTGKKTVPQRWNLKMFFEVCALLLAVFFSNCRVPSPISDGRRVPTLRVGIVEGKKTVEFRVSGRVAFSERGQGRSFLQRNEGLWRVDVLASEPAPLIFRLAVGRTPDRFRAEEIAASLRRKGLQAEIETHRRSSEWRLPFLTSTMNQVLLKQRFNTGAAARKYQADIRDKTGTEIVEVAAGPASGTLRFTNLKSRATFESRRSVGLTAAVMELRDVDFGAGFHWEGKKTRRYQGALEFLVDRWGTVTVVNIVSIEDYLKGVVPSEMPVGFPLEALKAQAVAARGEAATKIDVRHPFQPFDLCDDVHCQVYSGLVRNAAPAERAVEATRGMFMVHRNRIVEAFYHGVCGGHTENNDNVWLSDPLPYLRGVRDSETTVGGASLQQERRARDWIDGRPEVFCNTVSGQAAPALNYSKKYFRWEVSYERRELERIIRDKTGEQLGELQDLVPKRRGVSGRIFELEVIGSNKRFTINKELAIRQALAETVLFSACFYVRKLGGGARVDKFVLRGAGWGHGVGMCQIGAARMAQSGREFNEILKHYYGGVSLQLVYN